MMKKTHDIHNLKEQAISQLWRLFDILRGSSIEDLQVVFLMISAYKDGVFQSRESNDSKELAHFIIERLYQSDKYFEIFQVYEPIIQLMAPKRLDDFYKHLHKIDGEELEVLRFHFSEIFEKLLNKYLFFVGKISGEVYQPIEITRFIMNFASLSENASIYNPFAGLGSYGNVLLKGQKYYGQEINEKTWALGMLRFLAHNNSSDVYYSVKESIEHFNGNICYNQNDSIDYWPEKQKFDLIVSTPPFKLPLPRYLNSKLTGEPYGTVENFLIDKGIHSLSNNGQLIVVLPLSFLFAIGGRQGRFKENLIKNQLIDTIVLLPSGLLSNTNIPVCIVVFKAVLRRRGYVRFVDASTFFFKEGPRKITLNHLALNELIRKDVKNEFLRYVSDSEIFENDFDLSVGRYFLKEIQGEKLSNFTTIIRGNITPPNSELKIVQIKNLKDDVFNCVLKSNEIEKSIVKRPGFRLIQESCILVATRWSSLKATYFEYTGEPIVISEAIVALRIDEKIVDPTFLINDFSADYVKEQLDSFRIGTVQPILRVKDLKNIIFQLPSIQEQRAKVNGIMELSSKLKKLETDKANLLSGYKKDQTESSTTLSHILGKPLLSIGSSLEIIQGALSKIDENWQHVMVSERQKFSLEDAFLSITKNLEFIQILLDEDKSIINISKFDLYEMDLLIFIKDYVKNINNSSKQNEIITLDIDKDVLQQFGKKVMVNGNEQKLTMVLNNIVDNARVHGFIDPTKKYNIDINLTPFTLSQQDAEMINYEVTGSESYIEVIIANNGKSFPKDFKLKDYIRKNFGAGKTQNRGLGGYEINEILKASNNGRKALNIETSYDNPEYKTIITFIIPVIN